MKVDTAYNVEARPHVGDLLDEHFTVEEIGGPSAFGWHTVSLGMRCPRLAYYSLVRHLRPKRPSPGMERGTLMHACLARHYLTGGVETFKPLEVIQPYLPDLAHECDRLLRAYFDAYAAEEARNWTVCGVEYEAGGRVRGVPTTGRRSGKRVHIPITCRYDLIVKLRERDGTLDSGCYVVDHKVLSRLDQDAVRNFGMSGQFLQNALVWKLARLDRQFGPLRGFIVNVIIATKTVQLERLRITIAPRDIARYLEIVRPNAIDLWARLHAPHHQRVENWPMNLSACSSAYGMCKFWALCDSHGELEDALYTIKPVHASSTGGKK